MESWQAYVHGGSKLMANNHFPHLFKMFIM
jgi:hypothetical protein